MDEWYSIVRTDDSYVVWVNIDDELSIESVDSCNIDDLDKLDIFCRHYNVDPESIIIL